MLVYQAGSRSRVHFDPECHRYKAWSNVAKVDLRPIELSAIGSLVSPKFCKSCSPPELVERPQTVHRICWICHWDRPQPCKHNGGVAVVKVSVYRYKDTFRRRVRVSYRWPENLIGAVLVDDPHLADHAPRV